MSVLVVGAGPVGLVTALLLAEAGIQTIVLEADAEPTADLRASTFHPPTLDMLAPSGVTDALLTDGLVCPTWQIRMHGTGERALFDLNLIEGDTDHPYRLQCEQATLTRHLVARFADSGEVDVRFGHRVVAVGQHDRGAWVEVTGGADSSAQRLEAEVVVGADGASSIVRQALGLDFKGSTYPETTVLVTTPFPFQDHIAGLSNVTYGWSETGNFALLRLRNFWRCSLYFDPELSLEAAIEPDRIQRQLGDILPNDEPYEILDRRRYRVHQRIVDRYRLGRVVLAGDAAHVNSPSGGMGMNGGIHDAVALAEHLKAVLAGGSLATLDQYSRRRRAVANDQILLQADRNRKRMTEKDPARRLASLRALQAIADDPVRARQYLLQSSMITGLRAAEEIV